jgi:hypothetical protein
MTTVFAGKGEAASVQHSQSRQQYVAPVRKTKISGLSGGKQNLLMSVPENYISALPAASS